MARWVDGQNSGKFVNVYSIKIVNEGRWVVKNMRKFVNVNCERPLRENFDPVSMYHRTEKFMF